MHLSTLRRPAQGLVAAIAAVALYVGAGIGPASAQTREHVLLARQFLSVSVGTGGASGGGEFCTDWTNEDGTHGTNCPEGGGGGLRGEIEIYSYSFG